jgi:hypothetical protein
MPYQMLIEEWRVVRLLRMKKSTLYSTVYSRRLNNNYNTKL